MCNCNYKLRPCKFKEWVPEDKCYRFFEGTFHQWGMNFEEFEDSVGNFSVGIIEKSDGTVVLIPVDWIQFTDKEGNQ